MSKTILTVDDSASIRQMISLTSKTAGYQVIKAVDGADGYAKATSSGVHAVITGLNMPNMDGLSFVRKFREHPSSKGVPVILLTTESDEDHKKQA